ncbi:hypothetical protein BSQ44_06975 [Aquibium oceanicum]|uniref:Uncharacterized protein n=1 Tax=Aquibium oceanicum TaxID=1670800 RepID=A0A1L3SP67_9HYPH|nr:hypothetical protein BSQ44_06975 [Aquibium oceanicum]
MQARSGRAQVIDEFYDLGELQQLPPDIVERVGAIIGGYAPDEDHVRENLEIMTLPLDHPRREEVRELWETR